MRRFEHQSDDQSDGVYNMHMQCNAVLTMVVARFEQTLVPRLHVSGQCLSTRSLQTDTCRMRRRAPSWHASTISLLRRAEVESHLNCGHRTIAAIYEAVAGTWYRNVVDTAAMVDASSSATVEIEFPKVSSYSARQQMTFRFTVRITSV